MGCVHKGQGISFLEERDTETVLNSSAEEVRSHDRVVAILFRGHSCHEPSRVGLGAAEEALGFPRVALAFLHHLQKDLFVDLVRGHGLWRVLDRHRPGESTLPLSKWLASSR